MNSRTGSVLAVGPAEPLAAWFSLVDERVANVEAACAALVRTAHGAVLAQLGALGARPALAISRLYESRPGVAVLVLADPDLGDARSLVRAGAQDVLGLADLTTERVSWAVEAAVERAHLLQREQHQAKRARLLHAYASEGYVVLDPDARFVSGGLTRQGRPLAALRGRLALDFVVPEDRARVESTFERVCRRPGTSAELELEVVGLSGEHRWLEMVMSNLVDEESIGGILCNYWDISERKLAEKELRHRALHDDLTGLANRAALNDRLELLLASSAAYGPIGVAFLDIDGFKRVNDVLGHAVGDDLLAEVGRCLVACVRPADMVARFGGDEFVLACEQVTAGGMTELSARVLDRLAVPLAVVDRQVSLQASIGFTLSRPGSTTHSLLSEADVAMYRAKELGRGRVVAFDESLRSEASAMLEGEQALRSALLLGQIVPYYQPIIDLRSGVTVGVEALARWQASDGTVRLPGEFIPIAEQTGLIVELGEHILALAATAVAGWGRSRPDARPLDLSVNLSARQLADTELANRAGQILADAGFPLSRLHVEITETAVAGDVGRSILVLQGLKDLGVGLAIDDFGTGASSLAYLRRLPVDVVKIDRTFVQGLGTDVGGSSIVAAIIGLARAFGMRCQAEGVETAAQVEQLVALGCDLGQGYFWSRPLSAEEAAGWAATAERPLASTVVPAPTARAGVEAT